jgi:polyprenyl-phospho-N-acetylgalactosaminyl synthase
MHDTLIVVPAWREATAIADVVVRLRAAGWNVLVVDDGSPDDTAARAIACGASVIRHPVNLGQGAALQTGFEYVRRHAFAHVVTFDADGQHRAEDVAALVSALRSGADLALGSRGLGGTVGASWARRWLLRCATWVSNRISGVRLTDAHCGLRAIRVDALQHLSLSCDGMAHASELLARARRARLHIVEVPVVVHYTAYSSAKGQRAWAAIRILWDVLVRATMTDRRSEAA